MTDDLRIKEAAIAFHSTIVRGIMNLLKPYPDGVETGILYRYIDDDNNQSIYRVKKLTKVNGQLLYTYDSYNGMDYAADVGPDWDDCFEDEQTEDLAGPHSHPFDIDFTWFIYNELYNYYIPRLEEN